MRAGAYVLSLLSVPLNVHVLQALEDEPKSLIDLRRSVGSPPETTMRGHLKALTELGVLERRRQNDFPGSVDYDLGGPGRELLAVAEVLQTWLAAAPGGALTLGGIGARSAVKALIDGWSSAIVRALSARPLSLTELNRLISDLNYPSLERRLGAMRMAGQIEAQPDKSRGRPYLVTDWLRHSTAPLAAAARWERRYVPADTVPIGRLDIEAGFLLTIPLLSLSTEATGSCRLAAEVSNGAGDPSIAGVQVGVEDGRVVSCVSRPQGQADSWVSGTTSSWIRALIEHDIDRLEIRGDRSLALTVLEGLHAALFRVKQRT